MSSNLKPFFYYFGGKYRVAKKYPKPRYQHIIEPFAGAAGYSTRYSYLNITMYEKHEKIFGLWKYLISVSQEEILNLPIDVKNVNDLKVCQEAKWHKISDYKELGEWCQNRSGQVIVCERDGADWLPFREFCTIKVNEGRNGKKQSKEVIWTND